MVNLWGPGAHGAARPAAVRPNYTPDNGAGDADDWFKDCTSQEARDGTEFKSGFLNGILANLRGLVRRAGVTASNLDDDLLVRALRRGFNYAAAGGTANARTVTLTPAPAAGEVGAGFHILIAVSSANTGPATLSVNGGTAVSILLPGLVPLLGGEMQGLVELYYDGASWIMLSPPADTLITTAVTKTVYGAGADFANLTAAFAWASRRRVSSTGSITFQTPAGQFVHTSSVTFNHPDGARIYVVGPGVSFPAFSSYQKSGPSGPQRASDAVANLAILRGAWSTELRFTGGAGIDIQGVFGGFSNILCTGDGSAVDGLTARYGSSALTTCAFHGFGNRNIVGAAGSLSLNNVVSCAAGGEGLLGDAAVQIAVYGQLYVLGCGIHGLRSSNGSAINSVSGAVILAYCNAQDGAIADTGSITAASGSQASQNGGGGWHSTKRGSAVVTSCVANNNAGTAFQADEGSYMDARSTSGSGNTGGYYAGNGSTVNKTGGAATGTSFTNSPAVNTVGNGNSIVIG